MTDSKPLTPRQTQALEWLERVGHASERRIRREHFALSTMDALVRARLAERSLCGVVSPQFVYYLVRNT